MKKISIFLLVLMIIVSFSLTVTANKSQIYNCDKIYKGVVSHVNKIYEDLNDEEKDELIKELYEEKSESYKEKGEIKLETSSFASQTNAIDEAYKNVMDEENYIVNLINKQGEETSLNKWEFNLNYLKDNYDAIKNIPNINLSYVDSYIEAYEWQLLSKNMPDEKVNKKVSSLTAARTSSYEHSKAVEYAEKYYSDYNTDYPDWRPYGGDCANFVSQCLYAGGKSMKGTPGSTSEATDWSNWFSKGSSTNTKNVSSTWRGANAFKSYWQNNATAYKKFTKVDSDSWNFGYKGDAISLLNSNGRAYHTMLIFDYDYPDFVLAAHSGSTKSALLSDKMPSGGCIIFNMR